MRLRIPLLLATAVIAGLFQGPGLIVYLLVTHFIAPIFFGVAVSLFWRSASGKRQALLLGVLLAVAEFVRLVTLCMTADVWYHLTTDGYARFFFATLFAFQVVAGFGAWHVARLAQGDGTRAA